MGDEEKESRENSYQNKTGKARTEGEVSLNIVEVRNNNLGNLEG